MERGSVSAEPKPWNGLRLEPNIQTVTDLINLVNQGLTGKDKDGNPINEENANFMVALGISSLSVEARWAKRHPDTTNINPLLIRQAKRLIAANRKRTDEYIKSLKTGHNPLLTISQLCLLNLARKNRDILDF